MTHESGEHCYACGRWIVDEAIHWRTLEGNIEVPYCDPCWRKLE